ncbi:hypothetical protein PG996_016002 [Apiospora saccharicola]|uniref:Mitochondrial pyruvate carrier n=1 Tax=Apiospora saccharicola TaxID=335842 RepID=A0ABR1TMN7_9PEZI
MSGPSALVKALNQKIRSNKVLDYFCSTRDSLIRISGPMTGALTVYAFTFMRYSLAVTPKNYLLFACHFLNAGAQLTQGYRWTQYHYGEGNTGKGKLAMSAIN